MPLSLTVQHSHFSKMPSSNNSINTTNTHTQNKSYNTVIYTQYMLQWYTYCIHILLLYHNIIMDKHLAFMRIILRILQVLTAISSILIAISAYQYQEYIIVFLCISVTITSMYNAIYKQPLSLNVYTAIFPKCQYHIIGYSG